MSKKKIFWACGIIVTFMAGFSSGRIYNNKSTWHPTPEVQKTRVPSSNEPSVRWSFHDKEISVSLQNESKFCTIWFPYKRSDGPPYVVCPK